MFSDANDLLGVHGPSAGPLRAEDVVWSWRRAIDPKTGFFCNVMDLAEVVKRGIKVVSNAGGISPQACGRALAKLADELGVFILGVETAGP